MASSLRPSPDGLVSVDMPDEVAVQFEQWLSVRCLRLTETHLDPPPVIPNYTVVPSRELWESVQAPEGGETDERVVPQ